MSEEGQDGQHTEHERRRGFLGRLTRSEQIIAALIGLVGVVLAAILPVILSNSGSPPHTSAPATPDRSSPVAASSLPPGKVVQDDTGVISLLVPAEWNSIRGNGWYPANLPPFAAHTNIGPGLNAAANVSDWFIDQTTPGIFVGASRRLVAAHYTPSKLLQEISFSGCATSSSQGYATDKWTGAQETWRCANSSTYWWTVAMWPHNHGYIVYMQVKVVSPLQQLIGQRALTSLSVSF